MKLGTKEIPALRLGAAAVLKAYLGGSQVWPLGFDLAALFAQGEPGVWYDPSDFSTLYQDSAGTAPVTAVEQPVGRILDKSGRGNHAYQTTATSRPVLSARYNLLTKTEQFDDAAWVKTGVGTLSPNTDFGADGTLTADTLTANAALFRWQQPLTLAAGTYTFSIYLRRVSGSATYQISINGLTFASLLPVTDTLTRFTFTQTVAAGTQFTQIRSQDATSEDSIVVWGASLVPADQAHLPYQRVNTATDYDADPAKFPHYLRFDGVDDWMVTNTITPGTDKAQVFAGVRKFGSSGGMVTELDTQYATGNGKIALFSPTGDGANYHGFFSKGSVSSSATANGYAPPITNVLTGIGDISGDSAILRVNGTQAASSTADQGTGNFLAYPLYIGRRGGTSIPFNGHIYSLIVRFGSNLPIETIEQTEAWINTKTGAY